MLLRWLTRGCSVLPGSSVSFGPQLIVQPLRCFAAAKNVVTTSKPNLNVGTIGHIDHGKTTLTAAITRVLAEKGKAKFLRFEDIDKGKEEQKRGITINVAHIAYESEKRRYAHTDCPGHSDFIKNMICGTAQMDTAILVIAATEGVMAQTKEHLLLAKQIGVENIIVFINKTDLVDDDVVTLVEIEALELLEHHGYNANAVRVVKGSALKALEKGETKCVEDLMAVLDSIPLPERDQNVPFLMPIASRVAITGRGTVLVGTVEDGTLQKGDKVEIVGEGKLFKAVASEMQVFGKTVKEVKAGDHCGVLCKGIKIDDIYRGMWMGAPDSVKTSNLFMVDVYLLSEAENGRRTGIRPGFSGRVFCSTWDKTASFHINQELLMPGEHCGSYMLLTNEVPVKNSIPFTIREHTERTIGQGIIRDILPPFNIRRDFGNMKEFQEFIKERLKNL